MFNHTRQPIARFSASASAIGLLSVWMLGWAAAPATAAAGTAANSEFGAQWDGGKRLERLTRHLDLDATQRERIADILQAARTEGEALRAELATLRQSLQAAVKADEFYADQVRIEIESKAPVMVELMMLGTSTMHAVRAELTPAQQAEADAMLERFQAGGGRRGWFGRRQHH